MNDDLIDRRLEFLYQRWIDIRDDYRNGMTTAEIAIWFRQIREAAAAYLESAQRYERAAPSARAEIRRENAQWN